MYDKPNNQGKSLIYQDFISKKAIILTIFQPKNFTQLSQRGKRERDFFYNCIILFAKNHIEINRYFACSIHNAAFVAPKKGKL